MNRDHPDNKCITCGRPGHRFHACPWQKVIIPQPAKPAEKK